MRHCPDCGFITPAITCPQCSTTTEPTNRMIARSVFANLPYRSYFRLPHGSLPFVKAGQTLADVPEVLRGHPESPRGGFFHPKLLAEVIPMTPNEYAAYLDPNLKPPGIKGLRAVQFTDDGFFCLLFESFDTRADFLRTLVDQHLDRGSFAALRMGTVPINGHECFRVALHFSDLKTVLTISIPQAT